MKSVALLAFMANLTGTFIAQIGLLMMKIAHKSLEQPQKEANDDHYIQQQETKSTKSVYTTPRWALGFTL